MNYRTWRLILSLGLGLGLVLSLVSCSLAQPLTHSAKPIQGRVVDAETGKPIVGAKVARSFYGG